MSCTFSVFAYCILIIAFLLFRPVTSASGRYVRMGTVSTSTISNKSQFVVQFSPLQFCGMCKQHVAAISVQLKCNICCNFFCKLVWKLKVVAKFQTFEKFGNFVVVNRISSCGINLKKNIMLHKIA